MNIFMGRKRTSIDLYGPNTPWIEEGFKMVETVDGQDGGTCL